jgi:hypothetical protein
MGKNRPREKGRQLSFVADYIRTLNSTLSPDSASELVHGRRIQFWDDERARGLIIFGNEADEYDAVLEALIRNSPYQEMVSKSTVERWLQTAILTAIPAPTSETLSFDEQLSKALHQLHLRLHELPVSYDVMIPVQGIGTIGLPLQLGNVNFFVFSEYTSQELKNIVEAGTKTNAAKAREIKIIEGLWDDAMVAQNVFARTSVEAVDDLSARSLATREIRMVLDVINFLSYFVPYNYGQASLPGDASTAQIVSPVIRKGEITSIGISYSTIKPYTMLELANFVNLENKLLVHAIENLLIGKRSRLGAAVLAAIQWAGRSVTEKRKEEAFLLSVIAMEALLLCDNETSELGYRLRIRLAHLLGETYEQRSSIAKTMSRLYTIRSQITHSGKTEVTDSELSEVQTFTASAIYRVLVDAPFANMSNPDHLRDWFDIRILSAEPELSANNIPADS